MPSRVGILVRLWDDAATGPERIDGHPFDLDKPVTETDGGRAVGVQGPSRPVSGLLSHYPGLEVFAADIRQAGPAAILDQPVQVSLGVLPVDEGRRNGLHSRQAR